MRYTTREIPQGHALQWRGRYVIIDNQKKAVFHTTLGYTCGFADTLDQAATLIEKLEIEEARRIMVAGTKAEGV